MENFEAKRKLWNKQQTEFKQTLLSFEQHEVAMQMFKHQHAVLHSGKMSGIGNWSFEDEVLDDMTEEGIRRIPQNCEHSVAWAIWHIARIEDVTMNMLVAGKAQLFREGNWLERMKITVLDTGNAMDREAVAALSKTIDIQALRAYRATVGANTREIVAQLQVEDLKLRVDPSRLQQVMGVGAVVEEAHGLIEYWSKRTIAGLLLMPPTRHNFVHLNEALKLKQRRS